MIIHTNGLSQLQKSLKSKTLTIHVEISKCMKHQALHSCEKQRKNIQANKVIAAKNSASVDSIMEEQYHDASANPRPFQEIEACQQQSDLQPRKQECAAREKTQVYEVKHKNCRAKKVGQQTKIMEGKEEEEKNALAEKKSKWSQEDFHELRAQSILGFARKRMASLVRREDKHVYSKIQKHTRKLEEVESLIRSALTKRTLSFNSRIDSQKFYDYFQKTLSFWQQLPDILNDMIYSSLQQPMEIMKQYVPSFLQSPDFDLKDFHFDISDEAAMGWASQTLFSIAIERKSHSREQYLIERKRQSHQYQINGHTQAHLEDNNMYYNAKKPRILKKREIKKISKQLKRRSLLSQLRMSVSDTELETSPLFHAQKPQKMRKAKKPQLARKPKDSQKNDLNDHFQDMALYSTTDYFTDSNPHSAQALAKFRGPCLAKWTEEEFKDCQMFRTPFSHIHYQMLMDFNGGLDCSSNDLNSNSHEDSALTELFLADPQRFFSYQPSASGSPNLDFLGGDEINVEDCLRSPNLGACCDEIQNDKTHFDQSIFTSSNQLQTIQVPYGYSKNQANV